MKITNNGRRTVGLPGNPAVILDPGESKEITQDQVESIRGNRVAARLLDNGVITVSGKAKPKPEPKPPEGAEVTHVGGGRYRVYVAGVEVTDDTVDKEKAEEIAAEYE